MSTLACAWTNHATARLGERFGSKSDKIKLRIEELIANNDYTVIDDSESALGKISIRLDRLDTPVGLVLAIDPRGTPVVITVLPKFTNKRSYRSWFKAT